MVPDGQPAEQGEPSFIGSVGLHAVGVIEIARRHVGHRHVLAAAPMLCVVAAAASDAKPGAERGDDAGDAHGRQRTTKAGPATSERVGVADGGRLPLALGQPLRGAMEIGEAGHLADGAEEHHGDVVLLRRVMRTAMARQ